MEAIQDMTKREYQWLKTAVYMMVALMATMVVMIAMIFGLIAEVAKEPKANTQAKDYTHCRHVAEQSQQIVSQDGILNDAALTAMQGRNVHYNLSIEKCLELV